MGLLVGLWWFFVSGVSSLVLLFFLLLLSVWGGLWFLGVSFVSLLGLVESELMCCLGVGCVCVFFFGFCLSLLGFVSGCVCPLLGVVESHPWFGSVPLLSQGLISFLRVSFLEFSLWPANSFLEG